MKGRTRLPLDVNRESRGEGKLRVEEEPGQDMEAGMSQAEGPQISPPKAESRDDAGAAEARVDVRQGTEG